MIDSVPLIQNANDVQQINASIIAMKRASRELDEKIVKLNSLNSELDKKIALLDSGLNKEIEDRKEAINSLDVSSVGGSGKYISAISETDGKISATASDITSSVSSGNSQPVTSGGVASAIAPLQPIDSVTSGNFQPITSNAVFGGLYYKSDLFITDTRSDNYAPSYYLQNFPNRTIQEFKVTNVINSPFSGGGFCTLVTIIPWADFSGGYPMQIAIDTFTNGEMKYRCAIDVNTWGSWVKIANGNDLNSKFDFISLDGIVSATDFENALNANDPRLPDGFHAVWLRSGSWAVAFYLKTMAPNAYCGYIFWSYGNPFVARYNNNGGSFINMTFNP